MSGENPYRALVPMLDKTPAASGDEAAFRAWYSPLATANRIDADPDNPNHHYDYRAAWRSGAKPDATGHWPSEFKTDGHPRRYMSPDGKRFAASASPGWIDTKTGTLAGEERPPNKYRALLRAMADEQRDGLQFAVGKAMATDPDAYARRLAIGRSLGVGHDAVAQDEPAAQLEREVRALDPEGLLTRAPVLDVADRAWEEAMAVVA